MTQLPCGYCVFSEQPNSVASTHESYTYKRGWQEVECPRLKAQHYCQESEHCRRYNETYEYEKELKKCIATNQEHPQKPVYPSYDFGKYSTDRFYIWYRYEMARRHRESLTQKYGEDYSEDSDDER
jgi:hypothetical protein